MLKTKNYSTIVCLGCWGAICCFASFEVEVACFKRCISFLVHNYKSGHSDWLLALQSAIFFHQFPGRHSPMPRPMPNNSNQRIYAFFPWRCIGHKVYCTNQGLLESPLMWDRILPRLVIRSLELVSTKDDINFFRNFVTSMMIFLGPIFW